MFNNSNEYLESKENERKEFNIGNKVKGALLCGMMVASIALTGCGNETQLEESTQVSQEQEQKGETYLFFDGISNNPIELNVVEVNVDSSKSSGTYYKYFTDDGKLYEFNNKGCVIWDHIEVENKFGDKFMDFREVAIFQGASIISTDYENYSELANDSLNFETTKNLEEINESNIEFN